MDCFGDEYSELYDIIYHDKPYLQECAFLNELFAKKRKTPVKTLLDFGCGTGNHSLEFAAQGFHVTGVDRSMNMLAAAQRKAATRFTDASARPEWRTELPAQGQFDVILSLFATLNYLDGKAEVVRLFQKIRSLLSPNGFAVIETWNGAAVPFLTEAKREKRVTVKNREILRRTEAKLDWARQVLEIEFTCFEGKEPEPRVAELHRMHYYTILEMEDLARTAGLVVTDVFPTYEFRPLELKDFSALFILEPLGNR